jgi:hypothetical protein
MDQEHSNIMEAPVPEQKAVKVLTFLSIKLTLCFHYHLGFLKFILPLLGI